MGNVERRLLMPSVVESGFVRVVFRMALIVLCVLCILGAQVLCGCAPASGEQAVVDQAMKYAYARVVLDMADSSVVRQTPDAEIEVELVGVGEGTDGKTEIQLGSAVLSDTMAAWSANEWAANRDDLFFHLSAHFDVICKQANQYGDIPQDFAVTCPDYTVVYDSQRNTGFVVTSTGVYQKTDNPGNPIGEAVALAPQSQ